MKIKLENLDEDNPVIFRIMRLTDDKEVDAISEMQLLPGQSTEVEITVNQSVTVFAR